MLTLKNLHVHLGSAHILQGIDLSVGIGEVACLLGRNGVGKSTTLRTIMGLVRPSGGEVAFRKERIDGLPPHRICARGLAWVPEDRRVFPSLTVEDNIRVAAEATGPGSARPRFAEAIDLFPDLQTRCTQLAGTLSGGQQQMLAIARAIASRPQLLLLDEPSEGLSPGMVKTIHDAVTTMRARKMSVLLVEQNLQLALALGNAFFVLARGAVVFRGSREQLEQSDVISQYLGVKRAETRPGM